MKTTLNIQEHTKKLTHTKRKKREKQNKTKQTGTRKEDSIQANKHIHSEKLKVRRPKGKKKTWKKIQYSERVL